MSTFAIDDGFVEAMVRGFRSGFLADENYNAIKTCNNLQELKIVSPISLVFHSSLLKASSAITASRP